ncbi:hypothetical protein DUNSADRAFT_16544 [Dunaliella salina]|uniref:Uncharacterized protein n=1 Tax=Dunaliella salina TaxID=3046 RepID=A0ABZ3KIV9_DUNSA|nr:hypothetical protein DUNSADRAFT_16544 [Dunaliella salina]|eukprot:KAF5829107.1 hypothetical protein DUNSADRAFT_16544 [Dunaliella salina]
MKSVSSGDLNGFNKMKSPSGDFRLAVLFGGRAVVHFHFWTVTNVPVSLVVIQIWNRLMETGKHDCNLTSCDHGQVCRAQRGLQV